MAIINYEGEREATVHDSSSYGKKIIEFMELRDYSLVKDSDTDGILQDKIFRRPLFDGERETYVEVKYTDLGLSDRDFLAEFGKYFIMYMEKQNKFYFKLFARKLKNFTKWKLIFDDVSNKYDEIKKFRVNIKEALSEDLKNKFNSFEIRDFKSFVRQVEIIQAGYEKLVQKIIDLRDNKKFNKNESYLNEKQRLIYKKEKLSSNLIKVEDLPKIYVYDLSQEIESDFWRSKDANLFFPYKEKAISINPLPIEVVKKYALSNLPLNKTIDELDLDDREKLNIKKRVIELFIISKGKNTNYTFNRDFNCLYVIYEKVVNYPLKLKGKEGHKRRMVARPYFKDKKLNFVTHRALKFRVTDINGELFIVFNFFRLFTKDGKDMIEGESAKNLHYKFRPSKSSNLQEYSVLNFLITLLDLKTKTLNSKNFIVTKPVELESPCKASEGELFDEKIDYDTIDLEDEE